MTDRLGGRYRLDDLLGHGAFATVHRAHDEQLDDQVAVKILAHNHAADPEMRGRFVTEGQVLRRLVSPHLIGVFDLAETDDHRPYLVLELCDRGTLRQRAQRLREEGWQPDDADAVALATPLAAAIGTMANADVVHRDLTPANILLTTRNPPPGQPPSTLVGADERLVVTDLGFCKDLAVSTGITASGGTDGFRPPEQQSPGAAVDVRTDLWAASAVLLWTLTGHVTDDPDTATDLLTQARLTPAVAAGIAAGLHADPAARPPTAAAWLAGIAGNVHRPDLGAPRPTTVTPATDRLSRSAQMAALGAIAVLAFAMWAGGREDELPPASVTQVPTQPDDLKQLGEAASRPEDLTALTAPTPTPAPTPLGPPPGFEDRLGGEWAFHVTTHEGWEYDVEIGVDFAVNFGKDISSSGLDAARFTTALHGGFTSTITPTTTERTAPEEQLFFMSAEYGLVTTDQVVGADPCLAKPVVASPDDAYHFTCLLQPRTGMTGGESWTDRDEVNVDRILAELATRTPTYYVAEPTNHCHVILLPDGTVFLGPEPNLCTISGPAVVDAPADLDVRV